MSEYRKENLNEGEKEAPLRSAGVENTAPPGDTARTAQAEQERLVRDPPPLVHVDPVTGKPIDKPLEKGNEANVNTVPGADPSGPEVAGNRNP